MDFAAIQDKINGPELRSNFERERDRERNLSNDEWQAVRSLANDRNIVIKKADNVRDLGLLRLMEAEKQLSDKAIYKDVTFNMNITPNLTEKSNKIFENLKRRGFITEKQPKQFRFLLKALVIWENCIFSLKFISGY